MWCIDTSRRDMKVKGCKGGDLYDLNLDRRGGGRDGENDERKAQG